MDLTTLFQKDNATFRKIRMEGCSWWIHREYSDCLIEEIIPSLSQPEILPGFSIIKKTDTRLIVGAASKDANKYFIIKIFKRPHLSDTVKYLFRFSRSRKEWRIGYELSKRGISTYNLIGCGVSRKFGFLKGDYLISREITGAKPLLTWVEETILNRSISFPEKKKVIHQLALFIRRIHDLGVYPTDFHQGNLLILTRDTEDPLLYLIDLHSIRIKREVTIRNRIHNLVQLNNFRISMPDRLRFIESYLQKGPLRKISTEELVRKTASASTRHWQHLWQKRKTKCLRPGKQLEEWRINSWLGMIRKDYVSSQILKKMRSNFYGSNIKDIKKTPSISVKELTLPQENKSRCLIIKEYKAIGWSSKVKALFRISRAKRAWINAHNLLMRGISTPAPVVFGEKKRWGIVWESFFITEKVSEAQASDLFLKELLQNPTDSRKAFLKKDFLIRLARLIRWMHQTNICHGDLKASNILVALHEEKPRIFLVDMDGVKIRHAIGIKDIAKDLSRMSAAFSKILSQSEQEYFLRIYGRDNRFFQTHKKKIMKKVHKLTAKKILQKQKV